MTTHSQELTRAVATASRYWRKGWTSDTTDAYARVLRTHPPATIEEAIAELATTWKGIEAPPVYYILEACDTIAQRNHPNSSRPTGDGQGCPTCRHEYPAGMHGPWRGAGTIIYCEEHHLAWPGSPAAATTPLTSPIPGR